MPSALIRLSSNVLMARAFRRSGPRSSPTSSRPLLRRLGRAGRRGGFLGAGLGALADAEQLAADDRDRIVEPVDHALLHRDDAVVRDRDMLGADLGAAPGDVAQTGAELLLELGDAVLGV